MRVLIADDHPFFRRGIRNLLEAHGVLVVGEARNGQEAVELARQLHPDIVLMDLTMPILCGLSATRLICAELPEVKVVVLTASEAEDTLFEAVKSGAQGYLLKNLEADDLLALLEAVARDEPAFTPGLARKLLGEFVRPDASHQTPPQSTLTKRERDVLALLAQGVTTDQALAEQLGLSKNTVHYHVSNILEKLQLEDRAQVVAFAFRSGLVKPPTSSG